MLPQVSTAKHLKDKQFYKDLYDLDTINECFMYENAFLRRFPDLMKDPKFQEDSEETRKTEFLKCAHIVISTIKTCRFEKRKETISNWMKSDKELDEKYANTEPSEYYCPKCNVLLEVKCKDLKSSRPFFFNQYSLK